MRNADIANGFLDALQLALRRTHRPFNVDEWYVISGEERFDPDRFKDIPENRRFGVWIHVTLGSRTLSFFWDGLEESVSSFVRTSRDRITELHSSRFQSSTSLRDRITATVDAVVRDSIPE